MKKYLTLLALITSLSGAAQDYHLFNSNDTLYFKSESLADEYGAMLTVAFDSVLFEAGDSVYFPFKTLHSNPVDSLWNCNWVWNGNWLGQRIIEKASGEYLFINGYNDTVYLDPTASIGTSFNMCNIYGTDSVIGTVTSVTYENFLNHSDSVKTITLSSSFPSFYMESMEIKVSKNYGLISMVPIYDFPYQYSYFSYQDNHQMHLVGSENPKTGVTKPTYYNIHNLEVGDEIVYNTSSYNLFYYLKNKKILSKTLLPGNLVSYDILYKEKFTYSGTSQSDPGYSTISTDTITETHSIADTYITDLLPGQTHLVLSDKTHVLYHSDECGFKSTIQYRNSQQDLSFECRSTWHMNFETYTSVSGANDYYSGCWNVQSGGCNEGTSFSYKSNSGVACGTPSFVSTDESVLSPISIFPNPTEDNIQIKTTVEWTSYHIYSIKGELMLSGQKTSAIDLSALNPGIFILQINTVNNYLYSQKIVKY